MKPYERGVPLPLLVLMMLAVILFPHSATAQSSGAIIGTVTDSSGAVIAGATVTVSGSSMMGTRKVTTNGTGQYQISPLDPGTYKVVIVSQGFASATREGIDISVGFTATINAALPLASSTQTVQVESASPVVDLESSSVTNDISGQVLQNLTAKADYSSIEDITPGVRMSTPDVGGSGAINYQSGPTYGILGEDLGLVEGLSTEEEASAGAPLAYTDEHSYTDMTVTVIGNNAEMPQPGALIQTVIKSGGNNYHGHASQIYENSVLENTNINARQLALGVVGGPGLPANQSNRINSLSDSAGELGGFIKRDKLWWFGAFRYETLSANVPDLIGAAQVSYMPVYTGKVTYKLNAKNTLTGEYQRGTKNQNPGVGTDTYIIQLSAGQHEVWPAGIYGGSWISILNPSMVLTVHGGLFFERGTFTANDQVDPQYDDTALNTLTGSFGNRNYSHNRWQMNGSLAYTKVWHGTHNFKFGGQWIDETASNLVTHLDNIEMFLYDGAPSEVTLYLPSTADLTGLRQFGVYAEDSWQVNKRLTLNLGVRFDQYLAYTPSQTAPTGTTFPRINAPTWNNPAERIGGAYSLDKEGKTVLKLSYGRFWADPYVYSTIQSIWNPNSPTSSTYSWTPSNPTIVDGLPYFEPGQQGTLISTTGTNPNGTYAVNIDPNLRNFYMFQSTAYVEREVAPNFGIRTGFVWNGWRRGYGEVNEAEPFNSFTVPVTVAIPGPDGKLTDSTGTTTAYNFYTNTIPAPNEVLTNLPSNIANSNYYTWEIAATKRMMGRWSMMASFSDTWARESPYASVGGAPPFFTPTVFNPNTAINTVNGFNEYSAWTAKATGTYNAWRGFSFMPLLRTQSGAPFARTFNQSLNYTSAAVIKAENYGAERLPTITIADLRTQKLFSVKERWKITTYFDLYNIFNNNATQTATESSGTGFLRPTTITGPRMAGFGAMLDF